MAQSGLYEFEGGTNLSCGDCKVTLHHEINRILRKSVYIFNFRKCYNGTLENLFPSELQIPEVLYKPFALSTLFFVVVDDGTVDNTPIR